MTYGLLILERVHLNTDIKTVSIHVHSFMRKYIWLPWLAAPKYITN